MECLKNKIIDGFDNYVIYEDGRIWSKKRKIFMKQSQNNKGYYRVILSKNGKRKSFLLHRLLALHFIPNPDNLLTVDHIDKNQQNNNLNNLRWASYSKQSLNQNIKITNTTGVTGVCFDKINNSYRAFWFVDKKPFSKSFSVNKYGEDRAKQLSIDYRREWEEKHYNHII